MENLKCISPETSSLLTYIRNWNSLTSKFHQVLNMYKWIKLLNYNTWKKLIVGYLFGKKNKNKMDDTNSLPFTPRLNEATRNGLNEATRNNLPGLLMQHTGPLVPSRAQTHNLPIMKRMLHRPKCFPICCVLCIMFHVHCNRFYSWHGHFGIKHQAWMAKCWNCTWVHYATCSSGCTNPSKPRFKTKMAGCELSLLWQVFRKTKSYNMTGVCWPLHNGGDCLCRGSMIENINDDSSKSILLWNYKINSIHFLSHYHHMIS